MTKVTRRELLVGAAGTILFRQAGEPEYGGFRMGMQSYSLRGFKLDDALARYQELGLKFAEFFQTHLPYATDEEKLQGYRDKLGKAGVTAWSYGVVSFGKDHGKNRKTFEFGKALGIKSFSADPNRDSFESLAALTKEYGIAVGIHNHGPGHRYDKIADVQKAIENQPDAIGACADLGHYIRSGEDPVAAIKAFGSRLHGVHLKDAKDAKTFALLGEGKLDLVAVLKALREIKYEQCLFLEYEEKPENPMDDLKACLAAVRDAARKLR
jgi:sugar phosphate isomerase/epimerase